MSKHAFLSASSSHRWLSCPPSAVLCADVEERASPYAKEGTAAHALCEQKVLKALGRAVPDIKDDLEYFDTEMDQCSDDYCLYVMEQYERAKQLCPDPLILVEQHLDFSRWVPNGFGTGDAVIIADGLLHIIDYKHGLGILVEAEGNTQMLCYAAAAWDTFCDGIYDVQTIEMTIFQPRRGNISTWTITKDELLDWAENVLAPTARLAYDGKGSFKAGSHCQFCKVKATCRERANENLELAKYDFMPAPQLDEAEVAEILPKIDDLIAWGNDIKDYALQQALSGIKYDGFKVVEGRSTRKYVDDSIVADVVSKAGFDPYEKKVLGITAMTSLLGKKKFSELLDEYVIKPKGKPALVPTSDKRPEMNTAAEDFKTNIE